MTCSGCEVKVKSLLAGVESVNKVEIDLSKGEATIKMDKHIATSSLQDALKDYPKYKLTEIAPQHEPAFSEEAEDAKSWLDTYKPILMIFAFITGVTLLNELTADSFGGMRWMSNFMAGFFLVFSFF